MRSIERVALHAVTLVILGACSDTLTGPGSVLPHLPPASASLTVEWAGEDLYTAASADTTQACASWSGGCRDLDVSEANEVLAVADHLIESGYWECAQTGYKLLELLNSNKIKVGFSSSPYTLGTTVYNVSNQQPYYVILKSTLFGGLFENRSVVVHEGYHARGNVSNLGFASQRKLENESLYDPAADQHADICT